ncbi:MAG: DUF4433 domain-containing protein [Coleofasciculaceae cyanobacterium]
MDYIQTHGIDYLYHMTYIDNLTSIINNGLLSHNEAYRQRLIETDISDPNVQDIRARTVDPFYERPLHEYVPLYFSPRNPMLYRRQDIQEDIVILGLEAQLLCEANILFTNGNAAASRTIFYRGTQMLDQLPWDSIRARSWIDIEDGRRIKCAEVLVYPKIEPNRIQKIFCYSNKHRETIIAAKQGTPIIGEVNRDLFF